MTDACALVQENRCEEVYEKKCAINMTEVTGDEEVTSCSRPLYRRCGDTSTSSGLVRRRRDTLQQHIQSLARVLADTLAPAPAPGTRDPLVTGTGTTAASVTSFPAAGGVPGSAGWRGRPRPRPWGGGGVQDVPRDSLQRGGGLPEGPGEDLRGGRELQPPGGRGGV